MNLLLSPPSRGAWIEIENNDRVKDYTIKSPPSRGAWIEITRPGEAARSRPGRPPRGGRGLKSALCQHIVEICESPPSQGAWIEISYLPLTSGESLVAPLAGGVD